MQQIAVPQYTKCKGQVKTGQRGGYHERCKFLDVVYRVSHSEVAATSVGG